MITNYNYIKWIQKNKITLFCGDTKRYHSLEIIGAKRKIFNRKIWIINCKDEDDLADKLQKLNSNGFMFAGGLHGWNPADIYILMRNKKLVTGTIIEIVWKEKNQILTRVV